MGFRQPFILGRDLICYAKAEGTFDQYSTAGTAAATARHVAGDAFKCLTYSIEPAEERVDRRDARATRSLEERIMRRQTNSWNLTTYMLPPGGATPPDIGPLLAAGFGTETIGGSSVSYSLGESQSSLVSLSLLFKLDLVSEALSGALVNEIKFTAPSADEPTVEFSGLGAAHVRAGRALTTHIVGVGSSTVGVTAGFGAAYDVGSMIQLGSNSASSVGYRVTGISTDYDTLTIDPVLATSVVASGAEVKPFGPTPSYATASPLPITKGSVSFFTGTDYADTADCRVTGFEITVNNNFISYDTVFGTHKLFDAAPGYRSVTGNMSMAVRRSDIVKWALMKHRGVTGLNPGALSFVLGGQTSGAARITLALPKVELDFSKLEVPEAEFCTITVPFTALKNSTGGDELTLTFDSA